MKIEFKAIGLLLIALWPNVLFAKLNVVATTADFASIAKIIGGDHVEITVLAKPNEDPHFVDAKPSFIVKLNRADVLIHGGAELEIGWLPALIQSARNSKIAPGAPGHVSCSEGVHLLEVPTILDRSKGDVHAAGNPHFMTDPLNAAIVAAHICESLCQVDVKGCEGYRKNLKQFNEVLTRKMTDWHARLAPFKGAQVVAYHNMWPYFAKRFELRMDLFLEPKPGIPPTPSHLAGVISTMKSENIRVIVVEPYLNRKTADMVVRNTHAKVLNLTQFPGGVPGTEKGYVELIDYIVESMAKAFQEAALSQGLK